MTFPINIGDKAGDAERDIKSIRMVGFLKERETKMMIHSLAHCRSYVLVSEVENVMKMSFDYSLIWP